jgi:hypothetical protein
VLCDSLALLDGTTAAPAGGAGDDQTTRPAGWTAPHNLLPYLSGYPGQSRLIFGSFAHSRSRYGQFRPAKC